jgi:two-component system NtrC family sensor kinase
MVSSGSDIQKRDTNLTRNFLEKLLSVVQDPIMVLSPDYIVLDANEALLRSVGFKKEDVVGKRCFEVSHRSPTLCNSKGHECPLKKVKLGKPSAHVLHEHFLDETRTRYYDVTAYPITNDRGEIEVILEIWRDISAILERQIEEKTGKMKQDLARMVHEDKMIALGKLVASAVHEINNPITAIHTFSKIMLQMVRRAEGHVTPEELSEMARFLELVSNESRRCGNIVTNLLSFSRHQKMFPRQLDLNDVVEKIVLLLRHKMELQEIELSVELFPDLPDITGDLSQIQQSIMNLVFNAMEAMPEGGRLTLRTSFDAEKQLVLMEVQDTGHGVPEQDRSRIFEPFFSTKTDNKGVGLGLAVVYGIIREHHGGLELESQVGKGTLFRISLPSAKSD